jgi:predicted ABC-type sugar transport system permease subunit
LGGGAYEIGAQALNFGALLSFMGVNAANFVHQVRHAEVRSPLALAVPVLGFLICGFLWTHLSLPAFVVGTVWMAAGIVYGAIRTRGFRSQLVSFDIPADVL